MLRRVINADGKSKAYINGQPATLQQLRALGNRLRPLFDVTVMVDVPEHVLRARLRGRWERLGLNEAEIIEKLEENDLPNGRLVRDGSVAADYRLVNG